MSSEASKRRAVWFLLLAAVLWSSSGLFIKISQWTPMAVFGGRSLVAALVFLAYLRRIPRRWSRLQMLGAVAYAGTQITFILATRLTTAANAIFLQYAAPVYVVLFGYWFLQERPQRADWVAMPIIFVGLALFFGDELQLAGLVGNVLAIVSGMGLATVFLTLRGQKAGQPAYTILLGNLLSGLIGLPAVWQAPAHLADLGIILYLGLFQLGLAFLLYSLAIRHVPALEATLIVTLEPILNPIWVFLVIGELPGSWALLGAALVVCAVLLRAYVGARDAAAGRTEQQRHA